jgi:hypothetical protein
MLDEGEDLPGPERELPNPTPLGASTSASNGNAPPAANVADTGTLLENWLLPERELPNPAGGSR